MNQPNPRIKGADEIFCPSCGEVIKREAILCVYCGVPTRQSPAESDKNKTTAIILSIFFGYWSWLYTMKKDWKKFLVCLLIQFAAIFWAVVASLNASDYQRMTGVNASDYERSQANAAMIYGPTLLWGVLQFSIWLWPVINASIRRRDFYSTYKQES